MATLFPDVVVNGEVISHKLIAEEAQNHQAPAGKPGIAWRAAARALAVRTLLLQEARREGLDALPEPRGPGREETPEEALIRAYLEQVLTPDPVTEADCRKIYDARPQEAKDRSYDDLVRGICDALEKRAWHRAAGKLVDRLIASATIEGVDMRIAEAA